jgi:hypothetical protein
VPSPLTAASESACFEGDTSCYVEGPALDFPLIDFMDEDACYRKLVELLHPEGLSCPRCGQPDRLGVHSRHREPVPLRPTYVPQAACRYTWPNTSDRFLRSVARSTSGLAGS